MFTSVTIPRFRYVGEPVGAFDEVFEVECDHVNCRAVYATGCMKKARQEAIEIFGVDNDCLIICGVKIKCKVDDCGYKNVKHLHCKKCGRFSGFELDLCWDHRIKQDTLILD